jgi:hypothetical protein
MCTLQLTRGNIKEESNIQKQGWEYLHFFQLCKIVKNGQLEIRTFGKTN